MTNLKNEYSYTLLERYQVFNLLVCNGGRMIREIWHTLRNKSWFYFESNPKILKSMEISWPQFHSSTVISEISSQHYFIRMWSYSWAFHRPSQTFVFEKSKSMKVLPVAAYLCFITLRREQWERRQHEKGMSTQEFISWFDKLKSLT